MLGNCGRRSPVNANDLKVKFVVFFDKIGDYVKEDDIKACHRLYNNKKIIVKFSKRKVCRQVLQVKKQLKRLEPRKLDFAKRTAVFISEHLCSYYKTLLNKCKKLLER